MMVLNRNLNFQGSFSGSMLVSGGVYKVHLFLNSIPGVQSWFGNGTNHPVKRWRCFTDFCRKEEYEVEPRSLVYKDSHHPTSIIIHLQETVVNIFFDDSLLLHYQASTKHFRKQPTRNHLMMCDNP